MAVSSINIASSTATNWLKEAQESLAAAANPGGLLGTLQGAATSKPGSLKQFFVNSQNAANGLSLISSNTQQAVFNMILQQAQEAQEKRRADRLAQLLAQSAQSTNYTPPRELDPIIYFEDGTTLDTVNNIFTNLDGEQIDAVTGLPYIEPGSIIQMPDGSFLDTKRNILTMADGTRIDTVTGLIVTT